MNTGSNGPDSIQARAAHEAARFTAMAQFRLNAFEEFRAYRAMQKHMGTLVTESDGGNHPIGRIHQVWLGRLVIGIVLSRPNAPMDMLATVPDSAGFARQLEVARLIFALPKEERSIGLAFAGTLAKTYIEAKFRDAAGEEQAIADDLGRSVGPEGSPIRRAAAGLAETIDDADQAVQTAYHVTAMAVECAPDSPAGFETVWNRETDRNTLLVRIDDLVVRGRAPFSALIAGFVALARTHLAVLPADGLRETAAATLDDVYAASVSGKLTTELLKRPYALKSFQRRKPAPDGDQSRMIWAISGIATLVADDLKARRALSFVDTRSERERRSVSARLLRRQIFTDPAAGGIDPEGCQAIRAMPELSIERLREYLRAEDRT